MRVARLRPRFREGGPARGRRDEDLSSDPAMSANRRIIPRIGHVADDGALTGADSGAPPSEHKGEAGMQPTYDTAGKPSDAQVATTVTVECFGGTTTARVLWR